MFDGKVANKEQRRCQHISNPPGCKISHCLVELFKFNEHEVLIGIVRPKSRFKLQGATWSPKKIQIHWSLSRTKYDLWRVLLLACFFTFDNVALQLLVCFLNPYRLTVDLVGQAQVRSSCFFWRHAALNRGILERAAPEPTGGRWEAGPRSFQFRSYATLFRKMDNRSQGLQFCSWWSMERADGSPPLS